jgi:UDP-galactopyranose mutase
MLWFYTPMMFGFAEHLNACSIVYDCMDELSAFRFADPELCEREAKLLAHANVVFTGGYSLYAAKQGRHGNIHVFPSAVDSEHFAKARAGIAEPEDQRAIPGPKLGFYGVIDERIDLALLHAVSAMHPDWSWIMIGPIVKIDRSELPSRPNLHWFGVRDYQQLPAYLAGWNVALMPFAINEATLFISPTKTPEYLAGGRPVVSTPIADVVRQYGDLEAVVIANGATAFVKACEHALTLPPGGAWREEADRRLATQSWESTFRAMKLQIDKAA